MEEHQDRITISDPRLTRIGSIADEEHLCVFVVGGYVRDALLRKEDKDIDILVIGDGVRFAKTVARKLGTNTVVVHDKFGTAMVPLKQGKIEFVGARKERYEVASRKPQVSTGTLEDDLLRRDFTVNALAVCLLQWSTRWCYITVDRDSPQP